MEKKKSVEQASAEADREYEVKQQWIREQMRQRLKFVLVFPLFHFNTIPSRRIAEFSEEKNLSVFCGTWNVNDKVFSAPVDGDEPSTRNLREWLLTPDGSADVFAVGFQETVDLNIGNVVMSSQKINERCAYWRSLVDESLALSSGGEYVLLAEKTLVGLLFFVYIKKSLKAMVKDVRAVLIPTGVLGIMGNKGSIAIRLDFSLTSLCFICSHFHAGKENVAMRNVDYKTVMEKAAFLPLEGRPPLSLRISSRTWWSDEDRDRTYTILDHDIIFWTGDLNYRIDDIATDEVFDLATSDYSQLVVRDQLNNERQRNAVFEGFHEGRLSFPPTYKYIPGRDEYAKGEKKTRAPAWCDRALWRTSRRYPDESVSLKQYRRSSLNISDHRPVSASFNCVVKVSVPDRERAVYQDLLSILDRWENSTTPKLEILERQINFENVRYMSESTVNVKITNVGGVFSQWSFVPKLDESEVCQRWLTFVPTHGILAPGEVCHIQFDH